MADVAVETAAQLFLYLSVTRIGPVWTSKDTGYIVYLDASFDTVYRKTMDGGATWGSPIVIGTPTPVCLDIWFDKWTPGDNGTIIHIWWLEPDTNEIHYRSLDTSDDSLGGNVTVFGGTNFIIPVGREHRALTGTKATGGNLYVQFWGNPYGERGFYRSTDAGLTWAGRTDGADGDEPDDVLLLPDAGSAVDVAMIYWDRSANELTLKRYNNFGNSWDENLIKASMEDSTLLVQMSAVVRHSDGAIILAAWSEVDAVTANLKVFEILLSGPTITEKMNVVTDAENCVAVALYIDQNMNDLYCAYLGNEDGSQNYLRTLTAFYKKSIDGASTWGSQTAYQEDVADAERYIAAGHSTPGSGAGRFEPVFFNTDLNDLYVNVTNSSEIAARSVNYVIRPEGVFAQDTYISSSNATTRYGLDATLKFGYRAGMGFHFAIIELPLRGIRAGATVTDATLTLTVITYPSSSFVAECERIVRYDWDQVTATYDEFRDGAPWTTDGGDLASSTPAKLTFTVPTSGSLTITGASFVTLIQDGLDSRASRLLIRLRGEVGVGQDVIVGSGQNIDVSKAPRLLVTTTEADLGRSYTGIKRAVSNWARGEAAAASVHYMAVGIGDVPDSDYTTRRRLKEEIYRRPILGATLDSSNLSVDFWASFDVGQGTGTITEIGLFEKDTTTVVDVCDSTGGWSGTDWSFSTSGENWEGTTVTAANLTTTTSNPIEKTLDIDLRSYNLDDYLQLWIQISDVSALDTLDVTLTDDVGTWTWTGLASSLVSNTFVNYMLKFKDAVATPSASGPSIVSKITFQVGTMQSDNFFLFDYIRVIPNEENILLWAPPPGGTLVKAFDDQKKIFIRLTTKRGTN